MVMIDCKKWEVKVHWTSAVSLTSFGSSVQSSVVFRFQPAKPESWPKKIELWVWRDPLDMEEWKIRWDYGLLAKVN